MAPAPLACPPPTQPVPDAALTSLLREFRSPTYRRALTAAVRYALEPNVTLLLEGESGTGKTRLARTLHQHSARAGAPFENVVLSAVEETLAGSELFGHAAGAFTDARGARTGRFVSARGGTVFLDEVGKASRVVQGKLLHVIEYHELRPLGTDRDVRVDVRVMAATNVTLEELVDRDEFLPDLAARLLPFRVRLPALRDRREDVPSLVRECLDRHAASRGSRSPEVDDQLMGALVHAPWPHNLRQLDATVHRILIDAEGADVLTLGHCQDDLSYLRDVAKSHDPVTPERIHSALAASPSKAAAARLLGIDRTTLHRHLRKQRSR